MKETWDSVLTPKHAFFQLKLNEVWQYRDLLWLFTKRDIAQVYKQTILGPLWFFIQPLLTTLVFTVVFGKMAGISTDGIPPVLFYLAGITFWNYFAECLNKTATTFRDHQNIFGKVYFARLIVPLSIVLHNLIKFGIQFGLFLLIYIFFSAFQGMPVKINACALLLPVLVVLTAGLGLGFGLVVTSMTTKYRDLNFLVQFGVQLLMYVTPVIFPLSEVPEKYKLIAMLNPLSGVVETFRYAFLGGQTFSWVLFAYSCVSMALVLLLGMLVFNRTEKTFMDVI